MFDRLFRDPRALARQRNGPLAEDRERYLSHCAEQQMSRRTMRDIARYTMIVADALRLDERPHEVVARTEIEAEIDRWFDRRSRPSGIARGLPLKANFTGHVVRWLTFLGRLQPPATVQGPYADHFASFADSARERGLSAQTIANYSRAIHQFLAKAEGAGLRLETLAVPQVDDLLAKMVLEAGYARTTIRWWASTLRLFFRFAEGRGWCRQGLASAIMAPRVFAHENLPLGPSWDEVTRLLAAAEGDRPGDIRDRALLMLVAVYGLRAGEVTALRLGDLDWEREVLTVPHSKSQRPRTYPLCRPVGGAVIRYLRTVRPRSDRPEVFLTLVPPLARGAQEPGKGRRTPVACAGIDLAPLWPSRPPTRLRHAFARTRLVTEGDRRPPRASVARDDPHLRQGGSHRPTHRRGCQSRGHPMNVEDLVTHYVAFRKTLGERCETTENALRSFSRAVGPRTSVVQIRPEVVDEFLAGTGPVTRTWHFKYRALKGFFRFAISRGHMDIAPLPTESPRCLSPFVPYIYSREEVRRLLEAIPCCQRLPGHLEPTTLRAILLLLYGAGLRRGEALRLSGADVDLANSLLTIRDTKFFKSRLVPIGPDLTKVLGEYARWRAETHRSADSASHFFIARNGKAIHRWTLQDAFERIREHAGVRRTDGARYQPRLHDLRHTFAVHRLTAWYQQGADVQRLLHHLSVYLGHARLAHSQVYLTLTPELMRHAGTSFERYACGEDNHA